MMPCRPPMAFCSTDGQAIFQTAPAIGPSTIDRSNWRRVPAGAAATPTGGDDGATSADDAVGASAADDGFAGGTGADTNWRSYRVSPRLKPRPTCEERCECRDRT